MAHCLVYLETLDLSVALAVRVLAPNGEVMATDNISEINGVRTTRCIASWNDLLTLRGDLKLGDFAPDRPSAAHWVFRAQGDASWKVKSTLERELRKDKFDQAWKYEATVVREFKRRAYHYLTDLPKDKNILEWLALLRHFGAPCRLVDVTYSFYVAAYFAIQPLKPESNPTAIWAFDTAWLIRMWNKKFPHEIVEVQRGGDFRFKKLKDFRMHFLNIREPKPFVALVNPFRQNERLTAQQGLFLCPGDVSQPFMDNLFSPPTEPDEGGVLSDTD
jgi:hypothetical protein